MHSRSFGWNSEERQPRNGNPPGGFSTSEGRRHRQSLWRGTSSDKEDGTPFSSAHQQVIGAASGLATVAGFVCEPLCKVERVLRIDRFP